MTTTKVNSEFIAVNAISGTIIADGAITSTHLAANSVDSSELVTGSIDTIHIAANQVTATKIVTNGVLTRHISDDQVTADKLANSINTDIATGPAALPKAGGTMTGNLNFSGANTSAQYIKFGDPQDDDIGNIFYYHGNDNMVFTTNASEAMRIDSSGNLLVGKTAVGVGNAGIELRANNMAAVTRSGDNVLYLNRTTNDGSILEFRKDNVVVGNIGVSGGNNPYFSSAVANHGGLIFSDGGASTPQMNPISSGSTLVDNAMNIGSASYRFKNLYLSGTLTNDGSGGISIDTSGNVGIGTTSPSKQLTISGDNAEFLLNRTGTYADTINMGCPSGVPTIVGGTHLAFGGSGAWTEHMRIDSSGNVGIGAGSPSVKLHVEGAGNQLVLLNNSSTNDGLYLKAGTGESAIQTNGGSNLMNFYTGGNIRLSISTSGAFTAKKGMIVTENAAEVSNVGFNRYNGGAWANTPSNTYGYLSAGGGGILRWTNGGVHVIGALSKSSGSFKIPHPLPSKTDTHDLVHSFVEAPQADNIYRGVIDLVDGTASINIDTVSGMTEGTYVLLNTNTSCFTSNETDWDAVKGSVTGNILTISCQNNSSTATVSWLVIGERHDQHMYDTDWTDENGKVIVEPLKQEEMPQVNSGE